MPLDHTPLLLCLKLEHACDYWHSSLVPTFLTSSYCKLRPNTEGAAGAGVLMPALGDLKKLDFIDVSDNQLGVAGPVLFPLYQPPSPSNQCIDVSDNQLGVAGPVLFPLYQPPPP
jgi:hypothetical protein